MNYNENEINFMRFMEDNNIASDSRRSYISSLRFISKSGFNIDKDLQDIDSIINKLQKNESIKDKRSIDLRSVLRKYKDFITSEWSDIETDINNIQSDDNLNDTEKRTHIKARIGQGKFRKDVIKLWKKCSVTEFSEIPFLIASHIIPWRASNNKERLDPYNSLLLTPNYDKLFDKGYISFDEKGNIILSNKIQVSVYESLGIKKSDRLFKMFEKTQEFLKRHNEYFKDTLS